MTRNEVAFAIRDALSQYEVVQEGGRRQPPNTITENAAAAWSELADKLETGTIADGRSWENLPTEYQVMRVITHIFNSSIIAKDQLRFFE